MALETLQISGCKNLAKIENAPKQATCCQTMLTTIKCKNKWKFGGNFLRILKSVLSLPGYLWTWDSLLVKCGKIPTSYLDYERVYIKHSVQCLTSGKGFMEFSSLGPVNLPRTIKAIRIEVILHICKYITLA